MKEYRVQAVNIGQSKQGEKNGKKWEFTSVGLKIEDKWYNSAIFDKDQLGRLKLLKENECLPLLLYKEPYTNKNGEPKEADKFKLPNQLQMLELRVTNCELKIMKLEEMLMKDITLPNPTDNDMPF